MQKETFTPTTRQQTIGNCQACGEPLFTESRYCSKCLRWHFIGTNLERVSAGLTRLSDE